MRLKSDGENISSVTKSQFWTLGSLDWNFNYKAVHIAFDKNISEVMGSSYRVADFTLTDEIKRK